MAPVLCPSSLPLTSDKNSALQNTHMTETRTSPWYQYDTYMDKKNKTGTRTCDTDTDTGTVRGHLSSPSSADLK